MNCRCGAALAAEATLPRGGRLRVPVLGTLEEVLSGPAPDGSGRGNLGGALRQALALSGYATIREFHKAAVVVTPGRRAPGVRARRPGSGA